MRRFAWAAVLSFAVSAGCGGGSDYPRQDRVPGAEGIAFADNATCAECHEGEFNVWLGSHHDLAMQPATDETVLGDFDDATFTHFGVASRFFRDGEKFMVRTEGPDGKQGDFEVKFTFGVEPLQQYLIEFPGGRLQCLTIAWDTGEKHWYHLYPNERIEADDPLHWTSWSQRWNLMCAQCHSTNLRKAYDAENGTYRTAWDEIDVSCQACHGPAAEHVAWARILPEDYTPRRGEHKLVVDFKAGDARYQVDQCAPCHSRRSQISPRRLHGRPLADNFSVSTLREGLYHADGQILDEVYVYGSFLQSRMYARGVRCTDCHDPHSLDLKAEGNAVCTSCHQMSPPLQFPTLPKKDYDSPRHHSHDAGGEGAECVSCHMPSRTYMVVDPRRDHSFRIPRPDLSVKLGTPNACNDCHDDKPASWALEAVERWYGPREWETHYAEVIAAGREQKPDARESLAALAADLTEPNIVRATALDLLQGYGLEGLQAKAMSTTDENDLVRLNAVIGLEALPLDERLAALRPLLDDPVRAVRMEAARALASMPPQAFEDEDKARLDAALDEYRETQLANADTPGARFNLALLAASLGDNEEAERRYREALAIEPGFLPAQLNLATLYNQQGRNEEAEEILRKAIEQAPDNGELRYSLGLLLAEENRLDEAARALEKAAELMPSRARVRYNYALALQHLGRRGKAEDELIRAHDADPTDPSIVNALVVFYVQQGRLEPAEYYAMKLVKLLPNQPGPREMLEQIGRQLRSRR